MSLLTNLVSHWKMNEVSGGRFDAHGTNHMSDVNGTGSVAGKLGLAANFVAASDQYVGVSDNASLSVQGVSFGIALWVKLTTVTATSQWLISKDTGVSNQREYGVYFHGGESRFKFYVGRSASAAVNVATATTFGAPTAGVWYLIIAWLDFGAATVNISINNGATDSAVSNNDLPDRINVFMVGRFGADTSNDANAAIDSVSFWKNGFPSAAERTTLYNGGNGLDYELFSGVGQVAGSFTMSLSPSGAVTGIGQMTGGTSLTLAFSGALGGTGGIAGSTTLSLAFGGSLTATGAMEGATTISLTFSASGGAVADVAGSFGMSLAFAGDLGAIAPIAGSFDLSLAFSGALSSNAMEGSFTISLVFTGGLSEPIIPPIDYCAPYRCSGEIESVGSAIVPAGYRLAPSGALELPDKQAPGVANTSYRLPAAMVASCKRIRKG